MSHLVVSTLGLRLQLRCRAAQQAAQHEGDAAAQQTADWGELLAPGDTLDIRIFQLSNRLGRGTPADVTLQF